MNARHSLTPARLFAGAGRDGMEASGLTVEDGQWRPLTAPDIMGGMGQGQPPEHPPNLWST